MKNTCQNCGYTFEGNYCNQCGQKADSGRVNLQFLLNELSNSVFQLNHGLLFTIKELTLRPGHTIQEYLAGKRKVHIRPLAFLFVTAALYVLLASVTGKQTYLEGLSQELPKDLRIRVGRMFMFTKY
ncbi:DUF3667 domain-containing protein [bacterium SCSIO 12741]|nr:DUF3667 domain-containing protein [bacterium SCSIO 12741]